MWTALASSNPHSYLKSKNGLDIPFFSFPMMVSDLQYTSTLHLNFEVSLIQDDVLRRNPTPSFKWN